MENLQPPLPAEAICFGLDRKTDEAALAALLSRFTQPRLLATLIPRLEQGELNELAEQLGRLLRRHLNHREYHQLFLEDDINTDSNRPTQE